MNVTQLPARSRGRRLWRFGMDAIFRSTFNAHWRAAQVDMIPL